MDKSWQAMFSLPGFPGGSDPKESASSSADLGSVPGSGEIPWKREWLPTPVFLPGEFHGQRSLAGCSLWGHQESDMTEATWHMCTNTSMHFDIS